MKFLKIRDRLFGVSDHQIFENQKFVTSELLDQEEKPIELNTNFNPTQYHCHFPYIYAMDHKNCVSFHVRTGKCMKVKWSQKGECWSPALGRYLPTLISSKVDVMRDMNGDQVVVNFPTPVCIWKHAWGENLYLHHEDHLFMRNYGKLELDMKWKDKITTGIYNELFEKEFAFPCEQFFPVPELQFGIVVSKLGEQRYLMWWNGIRMKFICTLYYKGKIIAFDIEKGDFYTLEDKIVYKFQLKDLDKTAPVSQEKFHLA